MRTLPAVPLPSGRSSCRSSHCSMPGPAASAACGRAALAAPRWVWTKVSRASPSKEERLHGRSQDRMQVRKDPGRG